MQETYIYDALRTPRAKAKKDGTLSAVAPQELVSQLIGGLEQHCSGSREQVDQLLLGCVGQVGAQGGHIALVSKLHAGLPDHCHTLSINNYCVSSLSAIGLAAESISSGRNRLVLAGGVECMSQVPFMGDKATFYGDSSLPPRARFLPVPMAADLLATREKVDRKTLDTLTARSHQRADEAIGTAYNRSLFTVNDAKGKPLLDRDESIRANTRTEDLVTLEPAFAEMAKPFLANIEGEKLDYHHSFAHAPPMVDGAALALLGPAQLADMPAPRARIVAFAEAAGDPRESLTAGLRAMQKVMTQSNMTLSAFDRIEFMEAFAVVPALFFRDYDADPDKVNVAGGHLAKGHPMGATGAVLLSTLLDVLEADNGRLGLVVATGASGIGCALIVERLN